MLEIRELLVTVALERQRCRRDWCTKSGTPLLQFRVSVAAPTDLSKTTHVKI